MKVITEIALRQELKRSAKKNFTVPDGSILSPAAKEYLQGLKIKIICDEGVQSPMNNYAEFKYIDYESGAYFKEKPEHMTQLFGNFLVAKSHPRIIFRGKLDSLSALLVLRESALQNMKASDEIIADLCDIGRVISEIMRAEVLNRPLENSKIIGYTQDELRERSHDPMKFFGIKQMELPSHKMGLVYATLNHIRAKIRELEVSANIAFCEEKERKSDILRELNRLSSALHLMMCKEQAGEYKQ